MQKRSLSETDTHSAGQETLGSLPCSQKPANGLHPEPGEPSPHLAPCLFRIHFNIIL